MEQYAVVITWQCVTVQVWHVLPMTANLSTIQNWISTVSHCWIINCRVMSKNLAGFQRVVWWGENAKFVSFITFMI